MIISEIDICIGSEAAGCSAGDWPVQDEALHV